MLYQALECIGILFFFCFHGNLTSSNTTIQAPHLRGGVTLNAKFKTELNRKNYGLHVKRGL